MKKNQLYYAYLGMYHKFDGLIDNRFQKIKKSFRSMYIGNNSDSIILVDMKGNVYGLGLNNFHQLGCRVPNTKRELAPIYGVSNISHVCIGNVYTLLLDLNGSIYVSGKYGSPSEYAKNFIKIDCDYSVVDLSCTNKYIYA